MVNDNNRSLAEIPKSAFRACPHSRCSIEISQRGYRGTEDRKVARSKTSYSCESFEPEKKETMAEADQFDVVRGAAISDCCRNGS